GAGSAGPQACSIGGNAAPGSSQGSAGSVGDDDMPLLCDRCFCGMPLIPVSPLAQGTPGCGSKQAARQPAQATTERNAYCVRHQVQQITMSPTCRRLCKFDRTTQCEQPQAQAQGRGGRVRC